MDARDERKLKLMRATLFDVRDILDSMGDDYVAEALRHHTDSMIDIIRRELC
jgi:hypothetical protein